MKHLITSAILLYLLMWMNCSSISHADSTWKVADDDKFQQLIVPINNSKLLTFKKNIKKVSVGNSDIADILMYNKKNVYILGKQLGSTNLLVIDGTDKLIATIHLNVSHDLTILKKQLFEMMPDEEIQVHASKNSIVLSGEVSSISKVNSAVDLASNFLPSDGNNGANKPASIGVTKIINLLTVGGASQVMLEVKVAEISRQIVKRLDIDFNVIRPGSEFTIGAVNGGASFPDVLFEPNDVRVPVFPFKPGPPAGTPLGPMVDEFAPNDLNINNAGAFLSFLNGNVLFNAIIDIAKENGLAKILAEPTLTTLTGQQAKFISGGEFPIPVPTGNGDVTIVFKEFGVGLEFLPVVLSEKRINIDLNITVSELVNSFSAIVGTNNSSSSLFVPSLSKRSVQTTVELGHGQTLGIAGLIKENIRGNIDKVPALGDLPIFGPLFRSQEFIKGQTELVIFVTPYFSKPIDKEDIKLPTDNFIEPDDREFYLLGKLEGEKKPDDFQEDEFEMPFNSTFGHQL